MEKLLAITLLIFRVSVAGQNFSLGGKVSDGREVLPFASIVVENRQMSTTSNSQGEYLLKLPAGNHTISCYYLGYTKTTLTISIARDTRQDIVLHTDGIPLQEITVKAGDDPAVRIMRMAISQRRKYLGEPESFQCQTYIKGLQKLEQTPKNLGALLKIAGGKISDTSNIKGVIYLSESESDYYFKQPKLQKEIMFSSRVSGDNRSFSFNQLSEMNLNFYESLIDLGNLSSRQFISPVNENAFLFYRFYLLGKTTGGGLPVNKIKVVPKRKTDASFSGILYVQDSTWRLTGLDLGLTKNNKINFVDSLSIRQIFAPVKGDSLWLPANLNFTFTFRAFGFAGRGYFNAILKNYKINPQLPAGFFNNEQLVVLAGANEKDSSYWREHRELPLTQEERVDYREKDSIETIRNTDRFKDSIDHVNNRLEWHHFLLGYTYSNTKKNLEFSLPGLITDGVHYNTVEGLNLSYTCDLTKAYADKRTHELEGKVRYGFANRLWGGEGSWSYTYDPKKFRGFRISAKSIVEQFNAAAPIAPLVNSLYTLIQRENHMKLFLDRSVQGAWFSEFTNGVWFNGMLHFGQRSSLKNTTDYSWLASDRKFTSNDPLNTLLDPAFATHRALIAQLDLTFRFKQVYKTLPDEKIIDGSRFPRLRISYRKGLPVTPLSPDFDLVQAEVSDRVRTGLFGRLHYAASAGVFLNSARMYFMDYKHLNGNQTIFASYSLQQFRLLPYYDCSSHSRFAQAHAEQHLQGAVLGLIPFINRLKAEEVIGVHFLTNEKLPKYFELNFGLENLFRIVRLDYTLSLDGKKRLGQGFTIAIRSRF